MKHFGLSPWATMVAVGTIACAFASAQAGTITGATGSFLLNGVETTVAPGKPITTKAGDRIETRTAKVTFKTESGDEIVFDEGTSAREETSAKNVAAVFLMKGSATGTISDKTQIGVAAGWASASAGKRSKVYVEATPGRESTEALFRAVDGPAGIVYRDYGVALPQGHSITLDVDPGLPGSMCFRTGQANAGNVDITRTLFGVGGGVIVATVPKATLGCFTDEPGNKTKICNDINSLKTAKIHLTTHFPGKSDNNADIGPGTCALIDNTTGTIEVLFSAVEFEILARAISLTTEFATLTQSNFSDVK